MLHPIALPCIPNLVTMRQLDSTSSTLNLILNVLPSMRPCCVKKANELFYDTYLCRNMLYKAGESWPSPLISCACTTVTTTLDTNLYHQRRQLLLIKVSELVTATPGKKRIQFWLWKSLEANYKNPCETTQGQYCSCVLWTTYWDTEYNSIF